MDNCTKTNRCALSIVDISTKLTHDAQLMYICICNKKNANKTKTRKKKLYNKSTNLHRFACWCCCCVRHRDVHQPLLWLFLPEVQRNLLAILFSLDVAGASHSNCASVRPMLWQRTWGYEVSRTCWEEQRNGLVLLIIVVTLPCYL